MVEVQKQKIGRIVGGATEEKLLNAFFVLYKTARLIDANNDTFKKQSKKFIKAVV